MKCAEFKENVAAFALDALTEQERNACDAHLAETGPHDGCENELRQAYETTALIGAALPPGNAGEHVWTAIESKLELPTKGVEGAATERPSSRSKGSNRERSGRVTRQGERPGLGLREGLAWGLAIAATVAGLALMNTRRSDQNRIAGLEQRLAITDRARISAEERGAATRGEFEVRLRNTGGQWQTCLDDLKSAMVSLDERDRALRLMGAPETLLIQLAAQGDVPYRASALMNAPKGEAMLLSSALAPQAGKAYQLWLIRGDEKISAGLLADDAEAAASLAHIDPALLINGAPDAIAVTVEPTGGMPQPTGPIVLLSKVGA
ncbi:MAG: anti-sigma factor [Candidatus Binatia bacterium]|nr:anti-sigma factor [Candidatus Binatia bacterium]